MTDKAQAIYVELHPILKKYDTYTVIDELLSSLVTHTDMLPDSLLGKDYLLDELEDVLCVWKDIKNRRAKK